MRYKDTDAVAIRDREIGTTRELVELIKGSIYCALRQKFEVEEVAEIYNKIDDVVSVFEGDKK